MHNERDANGHTNRSNSDGICSQHIVDSLPVDAAHEQSITRESDCSSKHHEFGLLGVGEAVNPPLDEEEFEEGNEEGVHHTDAEYDRVGVLHG